MSQVRLTSKLTPLQASLVSFLAATAVVAGLIVIVVGYRETTLGMMVLGGVIAVVVGGTIFVRPQLGAYILVVSIFMNMSSILIEQGFPSTNKPLVALVFLSVVANRLLSRHRLLLPLKSTEFFLLSYGGVWLISSFAAADQGVSLDRVIEFAKDFVILLCVVYPLASRPASWKTAIWLVIVSVGTLAGLGTYQILTGHTSQTFWGFSKFMQAQIITNVDDARMIGPLDDPNFYGQVLVAVLPLAIYRLLDERSLRLKLVAGASALFITVSILYTYSRGAFLALILIILLIAVQRRVKISLMVMIVLTSLVLMRFLPAGFTDRLETLSIFTNKEASVRSEVSFKGRTSEMLTGINMFLDHPFLGVGVANYPVYYQEYASKLGLEHRTEDRQAHSLYLEIAAETGMLGLLTFGGLITSLLLGLSRASRSLRVVHQQGHWHSWFVSVQISILAYLTASIFLHGDYIRYLWLLVALAAAAIHLSEFVLRSAQPGIAENKVKIHSAQAAYV